MNSAMRRKTEGQLSITVLNLYLIYILKNNLSKVTCLYYLNETYRYISGCWKNVKKAFYGLN